MTWQEELKEKVHGNIVAKVGIDGVFYLVSNNIDEVLFRSQEGKVQTYPNVDAIIEHLEANPDYNTITVF
ncbi:MAG: hypothetical protein JWN30_971 [Bacilli bacterium]|nr:hypothetical protein [Bacilli bacterium]